MKNKENYRNRFVIFLRKLYQFKIDRLIRMVISFFTKKLGLKDIIILESHNDFDCNGGAFYNYLIQNEYNKKYKIVWLLKNGMRKDLPKNVCAFMLKRPSVKKDYYICRAKYILCDNYLVEKNHKKQIIVYCTHGAGGLKNVKGNLTIPDYVSYVLLQSPRYAPIQADQYSMRFPSDRIVYLGYPSHDVLNSCNDSEINKITSRKFQKVIVWMPTFRKKEGDSMRNDSNAELPLGIPLISDMNEFYRLNDSLKKRGILLVIKLHPMQDLKGLRIRNCSNIKVLDAMSVKRLKVDTYRLMSCSDALISDYSGVAYEYLQTNKPIAYVLSDAKDYKLGFVVEDIDTLMAGAKIYTIEDMYKFIDDISKGNDIYIKKREELRDYIYEYHDHDNCKRLARFLKL